MPTTETRLGERLSAVNSVKTMEVGTPMTSEAAMVLVYGRISRHSGLAFLEGGLLPWGWKKDQILERCLARQGGVVLYSSIPF